MGYAGCSKSGRGIIEPRYSPASLQLHLRSTRSKPIPFPYRLAGGNSPDSRPPRREGRTGISGLQSSIGHNRDRTTQRIDADIATPDIGQVLRRHAGLQVRHALQPGIGADPVQTQQQARLYKRAAETALRRGLRDVAAGFEEADARADALTGNCRTVRHLGRPALALAMCGQATQAEKLAAETSKAFPNGTLWNAVQLPEIRAAIELQRGQPATAVELLASASPYERAYPEAVYLRGLAYLRLRKGVEAAAEFQKMVDHKGASWGSTWRYPNWGLCYSISYLGLARGSALAGDTAKATKAFQDLFALWKDADADLPLLVDAHKEYAKLE
jgi:tetratricopeptide (TPR) repeat protein